MNLKKEIDNLKEKKKKLENKEKELNNLNMNFKKEKVKFDFSKLPNKVGLQNIGATCYMNATLQVLSNTDDFTQYFLTKYNNDQNKKMSNEMHKVLINLWSDNKKVSDYPLYDFKNALSEENELFAGIKANDSKDLINFLLERFHQEMNISKKHSAPEENVNQTDEEQVYKSFMKEYFSNNIQ